MGNCTCGHPLNNHQWYKYHRGQKFEEGTPIVSGCWTGEWPDICACEEYHEQEE